MNTTLVINITEGSFTAHYSERGLARLDFPQAEQNTSGGGNARTATSLLPLLGERAGLARHSAATAGVRAGVPTHSAHHSNVKNAAPSAQVKRWHEATSRALNEALAGRTPRTLPPLDLSSGTDFQRRVWSALRRIAAGRTRSYSEVAAEIGSPAAMRAVGGACGANPIPVFVPCHRVLAANRRLGGFSGGLDWKRKLLAREGVAVE